MVDPAYKNYLLEQVHTWKYKTILNKLTEDDINKWKPKQPESWELIDPYSDIEVVYSSGNDSAGKAAGDTTVDDINVRPDSESDQEDNLDKPTYNL